MSETTQYNSSPKPFDVAQPQRKRYDIEPNTLEERFDEARVAQMEADVQHTYSEVRLNIARARLAELEGDRAALSNAYFHKKQEGHEAIDEQIKEMENGDASA